MGHGQQAFLHVLQLPSLSQLALQTTRISSIAIAAPSLDTYWLADQDRPIEVRATYDADKWNWGKPDAEVSASSNTYATDGD